MAWCRPSDKPFPEPMLTQFTDAYMRHKGKVSQYIMGCVLFTLYTLRCNEKCYTINQILSWDHFTLTEPPHFGRQYIARNLNLLLFYRNHVDAIKWKHFPRHWPFVRGVQQSPVDSPHKGQWRGAFVVFFLICIWTNKRLSKRSRRRWFETPSRSLWRHCNEQLVAWKRFPHYCAFWGEPVIGGFY